MPYKWEKELSEHKKFVNSVQLYVCDCMDNKVPVKVIKRSLEIIVDKELERIESFIKSGKALKPHDLGRLKK